MNKDGRYEITRTNTSDLKYASSIMEAAKLMLIHLVDCHEISQFGPADKMISLLILPAKWKIFVFGFQMYTAWEMPRINRLLQSTNIIRRSLDIQIFSCQNLYNRQVNRCSKPRDWML